MVYTEYYEHRLWTMFMDIDYQSATKCIFFITDCVIFYES